MYTDLTHETHETNQVNKHQFELASLEEAGRGIFHKRKTTHLAGGLEGRSGVSIFTRERGGIFGAKMGGLVFSWCSFNIMK